jgi:hypothetical protein
MIEMGDLATTGGFGAEPVDLAGEIACNLARW